MDRTKVPGTPIVLPSRWDDRNALVSSDIGTAGMNFSFRDFDLRKKLALIILVLGVLPMLIVSGVLYRRSTAALERAGEIADVAMRAQVSGRLEAINQVKGQAIERYFANIDKQIVTFSQNGMVVDAMTRFSEHFVSYAPGLHLSDDRLAEMRTELERYYVDPFAVEYASQNDGATIDARALLRGLDDETMLLQWSYIAANPHPLGEKHTWTA